MDRAKQVAKPLIQAKFDRQVDRSVPLPCGYKDADVVHVAVHVRRGDVQRWTPAALTAGPNERFGTPDSYFIEVRSVTTSGCQLGGGAMGG